MGGRHQAPKRGRRPRAGGKTAGAQSRPAAEQPQVSAPRPTPPPTAAAGRPPQPAAAAQPRPAPPKAGPPPGPRPASWWVVAEVGGLALLIVIVAVVLILTDTVVDWRQSLGGAALLLAPILVRHIVLGVRRRWWALAVAYTALFVVGVGGLLAGDLALPHTVAGFGTAALGVLVGGTGFVLTSRRFGRAKTARSAKATVKKAAKKAAPAAPAPHGPAHPPLRYPPDQNFTDTLPQVLPRQDRGVRDDDSLAG